MAGKSQSNVGVEIHKGVFSAPSFITIGDSYVKKNKTDSRQAGKTMMTMPALIGTMGSAYPSGPNSVFFEKEHKWLMKSKKYADLLPEKIGLTQVRDEKRGKVAFCSTDANRKGEFCNVIRCEQYNQQINKEVDIMKTSQPTTYDRTDALMPEHNRKYMEGKLEPDTEDVKSGPNKLYDIGRSANTQYSLKQHRDMFYGKRHVQETKRLGPHRTHCASLKVGWGHLEATKFKEISEFANKPIVRSTFYRRTGLPGVAGGGKLDGTTTMSAGPDPLL